VVGLRLEDNLVFSRKLAKKATDERHCL